MNETPHQRTLLAVWTVLLLAACLLLHTRHHRFPYFYHPDEPGKVEQVLTGKWNFHHPMLLLSSTKLVSVLGGGPYNEQATVEIGRRVSATFTAIAIVAFSLLAFMWRGWIAAVTVGLVLGLHHQLFELAHYMKEDSAMLMGLALTFLAAAFYWQNPSLARAGLLGTACALAISGKYLGIISLAVAVPVLWVKKEKAFPAIFLATLFATFALVNLPLLTNPDVFIHSLKGEMDFVVHGQKETTRSVPHAQYWSVFLDNTTPAIWLFLLVFLFARTRDWRSLTVPEVMLIAFPFVYAVMLSFSPKSNDRYFLPASAAFSFLAALGLGDAMRLLAGKINPRWVLGAGIVLLVGFQITGWSRSRPGLIRYDTAFQRDDLQELIAWINRELPRDAIIAKEKSVRLPDPERKKDRSRVGVIPQRVIGSRYVADFGTLDQLRAKGVTHVIVSRSDYGRYFLAGLRPKDKEAEKFNLKKAFYEMLFREGTLLWERERTTVIYLHPGLRVYQITAS